MRTLKALVCVAAVAAGIATSVAQSNVYSLNVVGYYNIPIPANQGVMIANQLNTTNNTIDQLIPNGPPGANFYKFTSIWNTYNYDPDDLTWYPNSSATLNMGEAALFKSPTATTLTFVGEVQQGALQVNLLAAGAPCVRSSIVPQAGYITSDLGFPGEGGDLAYKYTTIWNTFNFDPDDLTWYPTEPTFGVGEGMLIKKVGPTTAWVRNFTVN